MGRYWGSPPVCLTGTLPEHTAPVESLRGWAQQDPGAAQGESKRGRESLVSMAWQRVNPRSIPPGAPGPAVGALLNMSAGEKSQCNVRPQSTRGPLSKLNLCYMPGDHQHQPQQRQCCTMTIHLPNGVLVVSRRAQTASCTL